MTDHDHDIHILLHQSSHIEGQSHRSIDNNNYYDKSVYHRKVYIHDDDDDNDNNGIVKLLQPILKKLWRNMRQNTKPSINRLSSIWLDIRMKIVEAKHDMVSDKHSNHNHQYMWRWWRRRGAGRVGSRLILHEVPSGPNPISNDISS